MNLRSRRVAAAVTALAFGGGLLVAAPAQADDPVVLNLLGINDFHGRIDDNTVQWAGTIEQLRQQSGDASTLLVSAGDNIGASLFASSLQDDEPTIDVLNALELDASAAGNHEFDRGYDDLDRVNDLADFPILAANVTEPAGQDKLPDYALFDVEGLSVAVVGAVTEETPSLVSPAGIAGLDFTDPVAAINETVGELEALPEPPDVIVASYHEGAPDGDMDFAQAVSSSAVFRNMVENTDANVDAIFMGHTHQAYAYDAPVPGEGGTRPVIQTGQYGENIGQVQLSIDPETGEVSDYEQANVARVETSDEDLISTYPRVESVDGIVDEALAVAEEEGSKPVGDITADITTAYDADGGRDDRGSESTLGNLVANAQLAGVQDTPAGADLSVVNPGGLRDELLFAGEGGSNADGVVTFAEALSVLPFTNNLSSVTLTGAQLKRVFEQQWQRTLDGSAPSREHLQLGTSDNVAYSFDSTRERGDRITSLRVDGEEVDPSASYRVAVPSFLASGGDNFHAFAEGEAVDTGLLDYEVFNAYLADEDNSPISPDFARHAVALEGLKSGYEPGATLKVTLPQLDLTSLGSPANESVAASLEVDGESFDLGTFEVTDGQAVIDADLPADVTGDARLLVEATPTGTQTVSPTFEVAEGAGGGDNGDGDDGDGSTPPAPQEPNDPAKEGLIQVGGDDVVEPGETITIMVGEEYAGQDVDVWLFSDPLFLGTHTVAADGTVQVTLPEGVEPGEHTLAVYDADGELIGYQEITVAGAGDGSGPGGDTGAALPDAGTDLDPALLVLGGLLLAGGAGALTLGMRRTRRA